MNIFSKFTAISQPRKILAVQDATAWELLNLPVDEGVDLFDNIVTAITEAGAKSENSIELIDSFDDLFTVAKVIISNIYHLLRD